MLIGQEFKSLDLVVARIEQAVRAGREPEGLAVSANDYYVSYRAYKSLFESVAMRKKLLFMITSVD